MSEVPLYWESEGAREYKHLPNLWKHWKESNQCRLLFSQWGGVHKSRVWTNTGLSKGLGGVFVWGGRERGWVWGGGRTPPAP